jgi:hypothetical protein
VQHARDREAARAQVARVVVSNPQKTRVIAESKVKTDKVDAQVLAQLLAADFLPGVWLADEETHALRREVPRRANNVRQRTRLKNQVQAIPRRNLVPRFASPVVCPLRMGSKCRPASSSSPRKPNTPIASSSRTGKPKHLPGRWARPPRMGRDY